MRGMGVKDGQIPRPEGFPEIAHAGNSRIGRAEREWKLSVIRHGRLLDE
jgi:hypothetical protein